MNRAIDVAIAVVIHRGRVLVGHRAANGPLAHMAEFPGGKLHQDETAEQAAARECLEETGIAVEVGPLIRVVDHDYPHGHVSLRFFACRPLSETNPAPPFRWLAIDQLSQLQFPPANSLVLQWLAQRHPPLDGSDVEHTST